jgi:hypothetical protein
MKARFWCQIGLGALSGVLAIVSLVWPQWIELIFGIDPDGGSGEAEWLITTLCALAAIISFTRAGIDWRRAVAADTMSLG